jgi:hypothetical protein
MWTITVTWRMVGLDELEVTGGFTAQRGLLDDCRAVRRQLEAGSPVAEGRVPEGAWDLQVDIAPPAARERTYGQQISDRHQIAAMDGLAAARQALASGARPGDRAKHHQGHHPAAEQRHDAEEHHPALDGAHGHRGGVCGLGRVSGSGGGLDGLLGDEVEHRLDVAGVHLRGHAGDGIRGVA